MRATSSVRSSPVIGRTVVRVRPADVFLFDQVVMVGEGGDLRQVGHAENLVRPRQGSSASSYRFRCPASDAGIDFVEHQRALRGPRVFLTLR